VQLPTIARDNGHIKLSVVSVLMLVRIMALDNVGNRRNVHGEEQRADYTALWAAGQSAD